MVYNTSESQLRLSLTEQIPALDVFETYSNHQSILEYLLGHRRGTKDLGSSTIEL